MGIKIKFKHSKISWITQLYLGTCPPWRAISISENYNQVISRKKSYLSWSLQLPIFSTGLVESLPGVLGSRRLLIHLQSSWKFINPILLQTQASLSLMVQRSEVMLQSQTPKHVVAKQPTQAKAFTAAETPAISLWALSFCLFSFSQQQLKTPIVPYAIVMTLAKSDYNNPCKLHLRWLPLTPNGFEGPPKI